MCAGIIGFGCNSENERLNIFLSEIINSFIIVITLGGIEKIKTKKKKKWQQNSLNNHITAKIYLALQNLHFSPQKAP